MLQTNIQAGIAVILTFCFVYYLIPILIKITCEKKLYDIPDGDRKIHNDFISPMGGVALFMGIFLGFSLSGAAENINGLSYLFAGLLMLFFTGLKDDLISISANKKLVIEFVSALIVMFGSGILINDFHGVLGISAIPLYLSVPLTFFTIIVIINAYNLIDGIDGLSGGVGLVASLFFATGFYAAGNEAMTVLAVITAAALLAFLLYNFNPASIFMGDNGTLVIGFLLAFMTVHYINLQAINSFSAIFGNAAAVLPVAFLSVPLYDTFTVVLKRMSRGASPFSPDRDHVHYELLRMGFTTRQTALFICLVSIAISLVAIALSGFNNNIVLFSILGMMVMLLPTNGTKRTILKKIGIFNFDLYRLKIIRRRQNAEPDEYKRWNIPEEMKEAG
ncbi:MraY family glycosyltransferase [Rhodohalobacter sp. 8-1]|uniref:MraY family glycosyltransferase n=1 Tax=Rhodohalobacter sp. 8-1 TaxID=3131972 RepID=UPI0030ED746B